MLLLDACGSRRASRTPFHRALLRSALGPAAALLATCAVLASGDARADTTGQLSAQPAAPATTVSSPAAAPASEPVVAPTAPAAAPDLSQWPEGAPPPPGYHWDSKPRLGPIIGGASLLGATWALSAVVGVFGYALSNPPDANYYWLVVPVGGPFVELTHSGSTAASVVLLTDGVAQVAGLALLVYGISSPVMKLERNEGAAAWRVAPVPITFGKDSAGLGVVGTF